MESDNSKVSSGHPDHINVGGWGQQTGSAAEANQNGSKTATINGTDDIVTDPSTGKKFFLNRRFTMLPNARPEPRPFVNKYFFKRPRLLQYYDNGVLVDSQGNRVESSLPGSVPLSTYPSEGGGTPSETPPAHLVDESDDPESSKIQRDWLNLFIDLIWVAIVSNISQDYVGTAFNPELNWGDSFLEFTVLFLTAFRFWNYLRRFLNNFFRKDFLQSVFLTWVLMLALFFGCQTQYFLKPNGSTWFIATFMVAKLSFFILEGFYCFYVKSIRREFLFKGLLNIPITALWIGGLFVTWETQAALILPAVVLEGFVGGIIELPVGKWFLHGAPKTALDPDNFVERLHGFFIIVLGEGVYGLISGNNWGLGLTDKVVLAIQALVIYYSLFWLFFTGDQTKTYIHAVYRNKYTNALFQTFHILLFASVLLLDASVHYFIENSVDSDTPNIGASLRLTRWSISSSLTAVLLWMTLKALLNGCLDTPGTLLVDNRFIRMAPRGVVSVVLMCLPIARSWDPFTYLGIIVGLLQALIFWEGIAALDKGAKIFEPKDNGDNTSE